MMGDNRDNSADSRDPDERRRLSCRPKIWSAGREFIFFSTDGYAAWWEVWNWPFTIRYDRLFIGIH